MENHLQKCLGMGYDSSQEDIPTAKCFFWTPCASLSPEGLKISGTGVSLLKQGSMVGGNVGAPWIATRKNTRCIPLHQKP